MRKGWEATFVVEGQNAEEAAGRVRRLLDKPLTLDEVQAKSRLWLSGKASELAPKEGYERAALAATLPGDRGFECIFYQYIASRTARLRERVYVTVIAEGEEFRPSGLAEHFPNGEFLAYQLEAGRLAGTGEEAFGKGRRLGVTFVCYSPPGSGAAEEAASEIRAALEKLREVTTWPDNKRSWFATRHGFGMASSVVGGGATPPYRPPEGVLPRRPAAPVPPKPAPAGPPKKGFSERVEEARGAVLERWGMLEDWDRMQAEREQRRAEKLRQRLLLEEMERQAYPFGIGTAARRDDLVTPRAWEEPWRTP